MNDLSTTTVSTAAIDAKCTPEERALLDKVQADAQVYRKAQANRRAKMIETNAIRDAGKDAAVDEALTNMVLHDKSIATLVEEVCKYLKAGDRYKIRFHLKALPGDDFITDRIKERKKDIR